MEHPGGANLRVGTLVEVLSEGGTDQNDSLGQIVGHSEDGGFTVALINGTERPAKPGEVRVPDGLGRPGRGGGPDSFDVLVGPKAQEGELGAEMARCLFEKGFCVLKVCQSAEKVAQAVKHVQDLGDQGMLMRLPEEVEEGYLGAQGHGKVAWLDADEPGQLKDELLLKNDQFFSSIASLIRPHCTDILGTSIEERTPSLVSMWLDEDEATEYPAPDPNDRVLGQYLQMWRQSQVKIMHFMGPAQAIVQLESTEAAAILPHAQSTVELEVGPNTILLFRTGLFSQSIAASGQLLSLSAFLLEPTPYFEPTDFEGEASFLFVGDGPSGPPGEQINVVNLATRLMANWDEPEMYNAGLYGSCDSGVEIPYKRWNVWDYYNADTNSLQPWQSPTRHQAYMEGVELFDNKYFEIQAGEASVMDPMHRVVLEVGAHNLAKKGVTKKFSNRNPMHVGCSVGLDKDDWDKVPEAPAGGGINNQAILANRFSFIFNLRGPSYVADTACSAALTATHLAKFTLQDRSIDRVAFHVAIGVHLCLIPSVFLGGKQNTMNSAIGRCLTFNTSASGYMRGDGCSGIVLEHGLLPDERDAIWRASQVGQNGRSATLTAPNGLAQQEVIEKAYREANITTPESSIWSCHGTGTSLGDPIECSAVRRVQAKTVRTSGLILLTNKTHTGHLEGGAAMTSLIAATLQIKACTAAPILHLNVLNPNLEMGSFVANINNEMTSMNYTQGNIHISSFGFGGTNGHVILWGQSTIEVPTLPEAFLKKLKKMAAPEVRVQGSDPNEWDWDGPEKDTKVGDKYTITVTSEDSAETAVRWVKAEGAPDADDDDEGDMYCITGPFNEWESDRLAEGDVTGQKTITVEVPQDGVLEFRFLKNDDEDQIMYPMVDHCERMTCPVLGPSKQDGGREKNTWMARGRPGTEMRINLFVCRGIRNVSWAPVSD